MKFKIEQAVEILRQTPAVLNSLLGNLSDDWRAKEDSENLSPFARRRAFDTRRGNGLDSARPNYSRARRDAQAKFNFGKYERLIFPEKFPFGHFPTAAYKFIIARLLL